MNIWIVPILLGLIAGIVITFIGTWLFLRSQAKKMSFLRDVEQREAVLDENNKLQALRNSFEKDLTERRIASATAETKLVEAKRTIAEQTVKIAELQSLRIQHSKLETRFNEQAERLESERSLLSEAKQHLFKEFELSANKMFEDKHKSFQQASKTNIELVLGPFKQQLNDFHSKVDAVYNHESNQRNQLLGQIIELQKQTQKVSSDASNLAKALKGDNKAQGDWGEIILERLLEQSGLLKGREYDVQNTHKNIDGRIVRPDVIVHLPDNKDIVIDSKVSLKDYEAYCNEEDTEKKSNLLSKHVESVKKHVKGLSVKKYDQIENLKTLDFVFIFVPIESAYLSVMEASPHLFKDAYEKNVVLVSPSSLMIALRTIETIWRYEKQNKNAEKIAASAGRLYDQFVLVTESLEHLGVHLKRADTAYKQVYKRFTSGKGNLLGQVDRLKELGAKTSKTLSMNMQSEAISQKDEST